MMNGCNEISESKIAENNERAKKIYRYVSDIARRIGEATAAVNSVCDLFSVNLEVQRQKLRDYSEKLLFLDPLNHGKKSLELLWRKVYYDTVSAAKKLRETEQDHDNSYLFSHIVCGIGHFHNFIAKIQGKIGVHFHELDYVLKDDEADDNNVISLEEDEAQFWRSALHSCLIYLGDLSRYQAEIFHTFDPSIAARYYMQAAHIDLSSGMPYNQLGNLYLDKNYNLDSVCYYIHCLSCTSPFDGAMGNLTKIFEKNSQFCESMNESDTLTQSEHIQSSVANFLSLIEIWYMNKTDTNIPQRCNLIAQGFKIAMDFVINPLPDINKSYEKYTQALEEENTNPSYLNGGLVHKIVQICLFTVSNMTETDEVNAFACKAFTLALLSQLLQKLLKELQSIGFKNPASNYKPRSSTSELEEKSENNIESVNGQTELNTQQVNGKSCDHKEEFVKEVETENDENLALNGDSKSNKKVLAKRRRRRRAGSSESSDVSDEDTESINVTSDESGSEVDNMSDSSYHSDDEKSDGSENNTPGIQEESQFTKRETKEDLKMEETEINMNIEDTHQATNVNGNIYSWNETAVKNFLLGDNLLPSIKLLQDWILTEKELILSCGDSGESMFQCVVDLLNIFTHYFNTKSSENTPNNDSSILKYVRHIAKNLQLEYKSFPLPEDIHLRGTNICKYDKDAAEWQILNKYQPSTYEENVIRILNFIDFGNQIAKIVPRIRLNRSMKIFYLKRVSRANLSTKPNHKKSREWVNSKKPHSEAGPGGLLARLGRLWLAARVRELERSGGAAPALLALDAAALNSHLRQVKQLMRARNFILLVPSVVVQELDDLKREHSTARDAIRWIEMQLKSGSRFVRAQRPGQSKPLPLLKYPRKAPPRVHNFIQILEFCNHFIGDDKQSQGGNGDPDSSVHGKSAPLLILLVGNEPGKEEEQYKEFSLMGAAKSAGISVEYIGDFYSKWRQTMHKSGKKR